MFTQVITQKDLPKSKTNETYPTSYVLSLTNENEESRLKLKKDAYKLLEHIQIVEEARRLYSEGKILTWEEFIKNEPR